MCCRGSNKNENSHLRANGDMSGHHTGVVLGHFVLMDTVSVNNIEMGIANRGKTTRGLTTTHEHHVYVGGGGG